MKHSIYAKMVLGGKGIRERTACTALTTGMTNLNSHYSVQGQQCMEIKGTLPQIPVVINLLV